MTVGRTVGTVALDRWGRGPVLGVTMVLAIVGAGLAVLAGSGPVAVVGVLLWGLGASLGFPVGMSAAADEEEHAHVRVSVVAVIGYTAFLAGPPLLGLLGDQVGTLRALLIVPILLIPTLALIPAARPQPAESRSWYETAAPSAFVPGSVGHRTATTAASGPARQRVPTSVKPAAERAARCQEAGGFHSGLWPVG